MSDADNPEIVAGLTSVGCALVVADVLLVAAVAEEQLVDWLEAELLVDWLKAEQLVN